MLTARAENLIRGIPDLADTVARLQAFEDAGADVLFAPGLRTLEDIRTVRDVAALVCEGFAPQQPRARL